MNDLKSFIDFVNDKLKIKNLSGFDKHLILDTLFFLKNPVLSVSVSKDFNVPDMISDIVMEYEKEFLVIDLLELKDSLHEKSKHLANLCNLSDNDGIIFINLDKVFECDSYKEYVKLKHDFINYNMKHFKDNVNRKYSIFILDYMEEFPNYFTRDNPEYEPAFNQLSILGNNKIEIN